MQNKKDIKFIDETKSKEPKKIPLPPLDINRYDISMEDDTYLKKDSIKSSNTDEDN